MNLRALAAGTALTALSVLGAASTAVAAPARPAATVSPMITCTSAGLASVSRATVVSRGKVWTSVNAPYSQTACRSDGHGSNYRTDCSGFVSMSWGLKGSYTTSTLPSVATRIARVNLQPGDMMDLPSTHAVIFTGWYDAAHTKANFAQEGSTASGAYASTGVPLSNYSSYWAYRYNHVTS